MNTENKIKDCGPAFPQPFDSIVETGRGRELASGWTGMPFPGLSKRELFAVNGSSWMNKTLTELKGV